MRWNAECIVEVERLGMSILYRVKMFRNLILNVLIDEFEFGDIFWLRIEATSILTTLILSKTI